jgi:tetratricopeptide (TPR) repeat protein
MRAAVGAMLLCLTAFAAHGQPATDTAGAHAAFLLGKAAVQARRVDEAVKEMERAVALDSANWEYHMWLGHAYVRQIGVVNFLKKPLVGRRMGAQYNKAVELAPENVEAAEARLDFYLNAPGIVGGGVDKADAEAKRITTLNVYRGAFATAHVAEHEKQWVRADSVYRALIRDYPDSSRPVAALERLNRHQ